MAQREFVVAENVLPVLSHLAGSSPRPISPWNRIKPTGQMTPQDWSLLEEAALLDAGQALKEEVAETMALLREPSSYVRFRLIKGPILIDHYIYSCGPEQRRIGISSSPAGVIISNPAPLEQIMLGLLENWGDSAVASSALRLEQGRGPALAFAALVDLQRRELFRAWSDLQAFEPRGYTLEEIRTSLANPREDAQWLVYALHRFTGWEKELSEETLREGLSTLIRENVLEKTADEPEVYSLAGQGRVFSNNFLVVSQVLQLETGTEFQPGNVTHSQMHFLQAGLHEALCLEQDGEKLVMEAVSNDYVVKMLDLLLSHAFVPLDASEAAAGEAGEGEEAGVLQEAAGPDTPAPQYYMSREGERYGPYTLEEMRDFLEQGILQADDLVWHEGSEGWVRADALQELFH